MAALALCAHPVGAQHAARPPAPVSPSQPALGLGVSIATEGELTAVLYEDDAAERVYVAVSDGRALTFEAPVRIDGDAGVHDKVVGAVSGSGGGLAVRGTAVYATWRDERNAGSGGAGGDEAVDVYFARSLDGGATWGTAQPVPKGHPPGGLSPVKAHALAVGGSGQDVYVLQVVDPNYFGGTATELWLAASHDGGATFPPAVRLAATSSFQTSVALALDGDDVHVAFTGQLSATPGYSLDVFHAAAPKGAGFPATPALLDVAGDGVDLAVYDVSLAARDGVVALAWAQEADLGAFHQDLYTAVSVDGGAAFTPPTRVGSEPAGSVFVRDSSVAVAADGVVVLAWNDDRNGTLPQETSLFAARSTDGGTTWGPEVEIAQPQVLSAALSGAGDDVVLTYARWGGVEGAFSRDGGSSWSAAAIDVAGADVPSAPLYSTEGAYNGLYGNALVAWVGLAGGAPAEKRVFAGGYRLPEVRPLGFASGGVAHVELAAFSGGAPFAWVVFAASPGDLPLPFGDGRNLGLAYDALLSLSLANPALLLVPLDPAGAGSTGSFALPLAPGTELHAAAVSLAFSPAVVLDEVADAVAITVE